MSLSRMQLRHRSVIDSYKAEIIRPPSRKQARAWLAPIRSAFNEIKSGEVDSHHGYAITRINRHDTDFARIDHCINGFIAMISRLAPEFDLSAMRKVGKKLPSRAQVHHVNGTRSDNAKNNLVICPSGKYHKLLHTRSAAFDATGDANKRRCAYCGKYDDAENLYIWERIAHHKSCKALYDKNRKLK